MASLREYFVDDAKQNMTTQADWEVKSVDGQVLGSVTARLHLDFDANAVYVSYFIPAIDGPASIAEQLLGEVERSWHSVKALSSKPAFPVICRDLRT